MNEVLMKAGVYVAAIFLGYILKRKGFFHTSDFGILSKIVLKITLPCAIIVNFSEIKVDVALLYIALIGLGLNFLQLFLGRLLAGKGTEEEKLFSSLNMSGFNIGAFTMPFVQGFLGPQGVALTSIFDMGNAIMSTGGTDILVGMTYGEKRVNGLKIFFRRLLSCIALLTYIIMCVLSVLEIRLPEFVMMFASNAGACNTFIAMLMLGVGFELNLEKRQIRAAARILTGRYILMTAVAATAMFFLPLVGEMQKAMIICIFSPIAAMMPVFTKNNGGDYELASTINSLSILISLVLINIILLFM